MLKTQLLAFFLFAVTAAVTPGPSNLLVMSAGARAGLRGGLRCLAGVVAGMALMMGLAVGGLGGVLQSVPGLLAALKWVGSFFLLWLAWKIASAPPMRRDEAAEPVGFWRALVFQWVNPKSWIVSLSAAATYGGALHESAAVSALLLAFTFALAAAPSCAIWLGFGAALQHWLEEERRSRFFNLAMGALLAASVLMILV